MDTINSHFIFLNVRKSSSIFKIFDIWLLIVDLGLRWLFNFAKVENIKVPSQMFW